MVEAPRGHSLPSLPLRAEEHAPQRDHLPRHVRLQPRRHLRAPPGQHGQLKHFEVRQEAHRQRRHQQTAQTSVRGERRQVKKSENHKSP